MSGERLNLRPVRDGSPDSRSGGSTSPTSPSALADWLEAAEPLPHQRPGLGRLGELQGYLKLARRAALLTPGRAPRVEALLAQRYPLLCLVVNRNFAAADRRLAALWQDGPRTPEHATVLRAMTAELRLILATSGGR